MGFMGGLFRVLGFEGEKKPKAEKKQKSKATYTLKNTKNARVDQIDGVSVYYPENTSQLIEFLNFVKQKKAVIISIEACDRENSDKILAFIDGFIFASNNKKVVLEQDKLYLILPEGMDVEE